MTKDEANHIRKHSGEYFVEDQLDALAKLLEFGAIGYGETARQELMAEAIGLLCKTLSYLVAKGELGKTVK